MITLFIKIFSKFFSNFLVIFFVILFHYLNNTMLERHVLCLKCVPYSGLDSIS